MSGQRSTSRPYTDKTCTDNGGVWLPISEPGTNITLQNEINACESVRIGGRTRHSPTGQTPPQPQLTSPLVTLRNFNTLKGR